jgi:hypothetical protein
MKKLLEALDLALEALELNNDEWKALADSGDCGYWKAEDQDHYKQTNEAITAIKQARSAPVQEPSCPECVFGLCHCGLRDTPPAQPAPVQEPDHGDELTIAYMSGLHDGKKKREWVSLTADERVMCRSYDIDETIAKTEAKLKEKNT